MNPIRAALEGPTGYMTGLRFRPDELRRVRQLIRAQWLQRIAQCYPQTIDKFREIEMDRYHELSSLVDHKSLWPKKARILSPLAVREIRSMSLVKTLERELGSFEISDEEDIGHEEMYWRLVRPGTQTDVGPLHADAWFWELGHGETPANHQRVKVWIAIYCDPGQNGFRMVPGSHKRQWRYHGEQRDGLVKPRIDEDERDLDVKLFESEPGSAIVFHDRLLHAGAVGGSHTRVSLEFTAFVKNEDYMRELASSSLTTGRLM